MVNVGQIIEFSVGDEHLLGVVTGILSKRKLIVRTADGVKLRASPRDVTFEDSGRLINPLLPGEVEQVLDAFSTQLAGAREVIDPAQLWEMASASDKPKTLAELTCLVFEAPEPAHVLGIMQVLREDGTYFKPQSGRWEARTRDLIAQMRQQEAAAQRKQDELRSFLQGVADAQKLSGRARRAEFIRERASHDDSLRDRLALLQAYGASEDVFERRARAEALLDELAAHPGARTHGSGPMRAFNLMVSLGLWSTHQNIWLHRYHIDTDIPESLRHEARALADAPWTPEPWREDLTRTLCATIDDASTQDIDDALSCVPREDGGWDLGIHIADPSAFVSAGSPLDLSARGRGTSIYLPTGTIPMFPRELSEGAMSLVAGSLRPALTTMVTIDRDLNVQGVEVFASTVKVDHRMTYDEVDAILDRDPRSPVDVALHDLAYLTSELFHQRQEQGAVSFDIPEAKIVVTPVESAQDAGEEEVDPEVHVELLDGESPARTLVSEAMIQASANMARFCHRHQIPVIYRAQEVPDEEIFDGEVMAMPEGLPRFFAMRRKMKRGTITTHPERHFGLGLDMYVQATSPIRRYSDLICQRQVKAFLTGDELPYSQDEILQIAVDVERASSDAFRASRSTQQYWAYHYLAGKKGERFEATVLEHRDDRTAFVFLNDLALRVKCAMHRRREPGEVIEVVVERANARRELLDVKEA